MLLLLKRVGMVLMRCLEAVVILEAMVILEAVVILGAMVILEASVLCKVVLVGRRETFTRRRVVVLKICVTLWDKDLIFQAMRDEVTDFGEVWVLSAHEVRSELLERSEVVCLTIAYSCCVDVDEGFIEEDVPIVLGNVLERDVLALTRENLCTDELLDAKESSKLFKVFTTEVFLKDVVLFVSFDHDDSQIPRTIEKNLLRNHLAESVKGVNLLSIDVLGFEFSLELFEDFDQRGDIFSQSVEIDREVVGAKFVNKFVSEGGDDLFDG
jgi:hypothetical protein